LTSINYVNLNALIEKVGDAANFAVVGFPSNNFGLQEPGTNAELLNGIKYVRPGGGYEPMFNISAKIDVNGAKQHRIYAFLKGACPNPKDTVGSKSGMYWDPIRQYDLTWNFEKFLVDRDGKPVKRYVPTVDPLFIYDDIVALMEKEDGADDIAAIENETAGGKLRNVLAARRRR